MKEKIIEAIKNENLFDFLCKEGHNLAKDYLIRLCKELDYAIYKHAYNVTKRDIREELLENIGEMLE